MENTDSPIADQAPPKGEDRSLGDMVVVSDGEPAGFERMPPDELSSHAHITQEGRLADELNRGGAWADGR